MVAGFEQGMKNCDDRLDLDTSWNLPRKLVERLHVGGGLVDFPNKPFGIWWEPQCFSIFKAKFEFLSICKIYHYKPEIKFEK